MDLLELVWRISFGFIILFISTRIMGRKEISQMTFFNFVSAIAIGSITASLYAIFETNGKLSVMSQEPKQPLTKTDMNPANLKQKIYPIAMEVISDGKVLTENLAKLHLDDQWLVQQIQNQK